MEFSEVLEISYYYKLQSIIYLNLSKSNLHVSYNISGGNQKKMLFYEVENVRESP